MNQPLLPVPTVKETLDKEIEKKKLALMSPLFQRLHLHLDQITPQWLPMNKTCGEWRGSRMYTGTLEFLMGRGDDHVFIGSLHIVLDVDKLFDLHKYDCMSWDISSNKKEIVWDFYFIYIATHQGSIDKRERLGKLGALPLH